MSALLDETHGSQCIREAGEYEYSPIQPSEIRLLVLEPGAYNSPLLGRFETARLSDGPLYSAISYAWGDPTLSEAVTFGGRTQKITTSLHQALQRFRSARKSTRLWADALCIDRKNVEEKNFQVAMMADIYACAHFVLIWLGESNDIDIPMFWLCDYWSRFASFWLNDYWSRFSNDGEGIDLEATYLLHPNDAAPSLAFLRDTNFTMTCGCCNRACPASRQSPNGNYELLVAGIQAVCNREYFGRLWPLQEMAVAHSAWLHVGQHSMSLMTLGKAMRQIERLLLVDTIFSRFMSGGGLYAACIRRCCDISRWSDLGGEGGDLLQVLCDTYQQQVSEPRDCVHAVRQLATFANTNILIPDYLISMTALWTQVALHILTTPGICCPSLLFSLSSKKKHTNSDSQLPSWAVDFGNLAESARQKIDKYYIAGFGKATSTSAPTISFAYFKDYRSAVCVAGRKVSVIQEIHRVCQLRVISLGDDLLAFARDSLLPWYRAAVGYITKGQSLIYPRGAFLSQDTNFYTGPYTHNAFLDVVIKQVLATDPAIASSGLEELTQDLYTVCMELKMLIKGFTCGLDVDWMLARTANGRFAWVPPATREGDIVCLLRNAPPPFILREAEEGSYRIVGDSFVDGIMEGEAWPEDETELETLEII